MTSSEGLLFALGGAAREPLAGDAEMDFHLFPAMPVSFSHQEGLAAFEASKLAFGKFRRLGDWGLK